MKFGSVCSGIEAALVAWHPLGWTAAWLAEIEPFPSAVLAYHYPDVPNHGDMTLLPQKILSGEVEAPDLFCGGTPCQAFSVAGLRNSLDDARGNLSLTFVGIANAIDHVRSVRSDHPAIIFWENVPGVLSTKDNAFGCFLGALAGEDDPIIPTGEKWTNAGCVYGPQRTVAWRVLDAQYFGVAQRRRRVFVVASARDGFDPAAVLFEFEGVRRDSAPSRETGKAIAPCVTNDPPFSRTGNERVEAEAMVVQPYEVGNCLTARMAKGINSTLDEGQTPVLVQPIALAENTIGRKPENGGNIGNPKDLTGTLVKNQTMAVAVSSGHGWWSESDGTAQTLRAQDSITKADTLPIVGMQVRRLTPVECERLQGFPDHYTEIPWRKKPAAECPDGPRYKALGNSWAVPVVAWIGKRIQEALNAP